MEKNRNLKLYSKYRRISRDFLFFYTINVLFLTQIKHIDLSAVVLVDTFYSLFVVLTQIPATIIIEKIGRKKGMILGNVFHILYILLLINSVDLISLICAEILCASGFALKDIAEPAILNESIELKKEEKSNLFAKIDGQALSGYYLLASISMIISGFLYEINGYIPMILCLIILVICFFISFRFKEPVNRYVYNEESNEVKITEAIKFSFKSKRCRCLLIYSGVFFAIISVLANYEIGLLEELNIPSSSIGILFAILNIASAIASRKQNLFQKKFKNRTLSVIGITLAFSCIISGFVAILKIPFWVMISIIIMMFLLKYICVGLYNSLLLKYLSNFTNSQIDTKIFAINNFLNSILSVVFGACASKMLSIMPTSQAMLIFGIGAALILIIVLIYMKNKVGLDPKKYSKIELKYDVKL